jgi:hypothetical protein
MLLMIDNEHECPVPPRISLGGPVKVGNYNYQYLEKQRN